MTHRILLSALAAATLALAASPAHADKWSYQIEPYVIGVTIDGDAGIGRAAGVDLGVDFSDILENLDMGGMVHFEARHESGWGLALDYAFMDLGDDRSSPRGAVLNTDVFEGILEAELFKGTGMGNEGLDYLAGLRWWSIEVDVDIDPVLLPGTVSGGIDEDWVDVYIGARWKTPISEKWLFTLRGDVGTGGADFTWQVRGGFRYGIGDSKALDLGYRALGVDYETGTRGQQGYFQYDTTTHGPFIGFGFKF